MANRARDKGSRSRELAKAYLSRKMRIFDINAGWTYPDNNILCVWWFDHVRYIRVARSEESQVAYDLQRRASNTSIDGFDLCRQLLGRTRAGFVMGTELADMPFIRHGDMVE